MIIRDIEFTLKDGRKALIRSPRDEDIQGMLDYLYISAGETEFILRYPEECNKYTPEGEKALFDRVNASENEAMLVCLVDGKVAGNCLENRAQNQTSRCRGDCTAEGLLESGDWNAAVYGTDPNRGGK